MPTGSGWAGHVRYDAPDLKTVSDPKNPTEDRVHAAKSVPTTHPSDR
jgi:hypothetical protein